MKENNFDINEFMKTKPHELVPEEGHEYGLYMRFAGQDRKARELLVKLGHAVEEVAYMSDDEAMGTLIDNYDFATMVPSYEDKIDDEVVFLVPREILKRCLFLCR